VVDNVNASTNVVDGVLARGVEVLLKRLIQSVPLLVLLPTNKTVFGALSW
jgi:hypothetical protein